MQHQVFRQCYKIPGKVIERFLKYVSGNGLQIFLYDEEEEYIASTHSEDLGFKFIAHDPIEPPFLKELGAGLAPGFHYLIALKQTEVSNI